MSVDRVYHGYTPDEVLLLCDRDYLPFIAEQIRMAAERVLVVTFIADPRPPQDPRRGVRGLFDEMGRAVWRGVDCRCILGGSETTPDIEAACRVAGDYAQSLGVSVRAYRPCAGNRSLHAKYAVIDGLAVVGSQNWTDPALFRDRETAVAVRSVDLAHRLRFEFERTWRAAGGEDE